MFSKILAIMLFCSSAYADGLSVNGNSGGGQIGLQEGIVTQNASTTGFVPGVGAALLLEDNASFLLLEDGASHLCLEVNSGSC